ncbi:hypothetical protein [Mycolicibacterium sp. CR10]|uniref:beta strand repeat-containing protein n=1 Tax=Mycolicibacterium sp. CR10 TaxID=2562314 RepID=UPI0010BF898E|nr:hypothetical protein [Mycolicibacterium sp. CR10]
MANSAGLARADIDPDSSVSSTGPDSDDTSAESRADAQQSSNENDEEESDDEEKAEELDAGELDVEELSGDNDTLVAADANTDEPAEEPGQQNPEVPEAEPMEETQPPSAEEQTADGIPAEPIAEPSTPDNHPGASGEVPDASNVTRSDDEVAPEPLSDAAVTDGLEPTADPSLLISARTTTMSTDLAPDPTVPVMATVAPAEDSVETVNLVSALVSTVVSPFADPNAPAPTPWFDALLAWVRRQIVHTFFNESPVWGPIESTQIVTGQVLIDLHDYDPNGDPLSYTIIQPTNGIVIRDPLTGDFIYTPKIPVTGAPLVDSFQVVISDSGEHLKGLIGLIQGVFHSLSRWIGLAEPDDVTVTIPVIATPIVELPPVVVTVPAALGTTGSPVTVSPIVVITDLDSTELTSATVTITDAAARQVLGYGTLPTGISTAGFDAETASVTFTGTASLAAYRQLLSSVTFTSPDIALTSIVFTVTDSQDNSSVPVATIVTVLGLPVAVAPLVVTAPVAAGTTGTQLTVSPVVLITDLDSTQLSSATVTITDPAAGQVLGYGTLPAGITTVAGAGSVTFTGTASLADYRQLLSSVTFTSPTAALTSILFTVTDIDDNESLTSATIVTVLGLPAVVAPLVVTVPVAAGLTGSAVTVSPVVLITDLDSPELSSATVTITDPAAGQVLGYGTLPAGITAVAGAGSVTFTGTASLAAYRQLLSSLTLTSPTVGISAILFEVTDSQGNVSLPSATAVTVLGIPVAVAPLVVTAPVAVGTAGSAVTVSPVVLITDLDSPQLASATVTITDPSPGQVLGYGTLPGGITAAAGAGSVTFTGLASLATYRQLLGSVTFTSPDATLTSILFTVTDSTGRESIPASTVVTALSIPAVIAPLVVTTPVAAGTAGSPITVSPVVLITDLDSSQLGSATVTISDPAVGQVLGFGSLPGGISTTGFNAGTSSVTFTGAASLATYRQLLSSVTFTSPDATLASILFTVTDSTGRESIPASTVVTVLGVPAAVAPLVVTAPVAAGTAGSAVTVSPVVLITDLDSTQLGSATVTITDPSPGQVLGYGTLPGGITAAAGAGSVTFTGLASLATYRQLLGSVTFTSPDATLTSILFTVTDPTGRESAPASTVITLLAVPAVVAPLVVTAPVAAGTAGSAVTVSPVVAITDLDSTQLSSATVTIGDPAAGQLLGYGSLPAGVTALEDAGSVTFTGAASLAAYRQLLGSVTFTSPDAALTSILFTVTDSSGGESAPASTVVTVLGIPAAVAPVVATSLVNVSYTAGNSAVTVDSGLRLLDVDSTNMSGAVVSIVGGPVAGEILGFTAPGGIGGTYVAGTGVLTFTGTASLADYQQALRSVTFASSGTAATAIRTITFTVTDSQNVTSATKSLPPAVQANAAPILTPSALAGVYSQTLAVLSLSLIPVPLIVDSSSYLQGAVIRISANAGSNDFLEVSSSAAAAASITLSGNSTGVITLSGQATVAQYQSVLNSLEFSGTLLNFNTRTIEFVTTDQQGATSNTATLQLVVTLI